VAVDLVEPVTEIAQTLLDLEDGGTLVVQTQ
jgi:hypothetical protein